MRFKVDENLPIEIAGLLLTSGYDAITVNDQLLQGADDSVLIERCDRENRVIITLDTDFSDIRAYPPWDHEGIIVVRVGNQSKTHIIKVFQNILPLFDREPIKNRLWIVEENMIRIRGEDD